MGIFAGSGRTADQSELASYFGREIQRSSGTGRPHDVPRRYLTLSGERAAVCVMNVAIADAAIACWDAKYRYVFWRPITAIRGGDTDGNPSTDVETNVGTVARLTYLPVLPLIRNIHLDIQA